MLFSCSSLASLCVQPRIKSVCSSVQNHRFNPISTRANLLWTSLRLLLLPLDRIEQPAPPPPSPSSRTPGSSWSASPAPPPPTSRVSSSASHDRAKLAGARVDHAPDQVPRPHRVCCLGSLAQHATSLLARVLSPRCSLVFMCVLPAGRLYLPVWFIVAILPMHVFPSISSTEDHLRQDLLSDVRRFGDFRFFSSTAL